MLEDDVLRETLKKSEVWEGEHSSPLHMAAAYGYVDILRKLLAAGADPNAWECSMWNTLTPLQMAVCNNESESVKILVERGVDEGCYGYWGAFNNNCY